MATFLESLFYFLSLKTFLLVVGIVLLFVDGLRVIGAICIAIAVPWIAISVRQRNPEGT